MTVPSQDYRSLFVGVDEPVPVLDGSRKKYINFDNAASTPALLAVKEAVMKFLQYYSSVHRGTGYKSQVSTLAYEQARRTVMDFFGADPRTCTCIFVKNTTEAVNKLARRFPFTAERDIVLVSGMEHHSNDLPWRAVAKTLHVRLTPDGRLDEDDFDAKLKEYGSRLALVAITGASNVSGFINPIYRLAEKAHSVGAQIFIDCAQLAPHREVKLYSPDHPAYLDYIAISAHKMYAPFGIGALVGRRDTFEEGSPEISGGGTVAMVTLGGVTWAEPPEKEEAGSPNTVGAVALAAALRQLGTIGMDRIAEHEAELTAYALEKISKVPGIRVYGDSNPQSAPGRLGVIPFNADHVPHSLVAAILGYEFGIGVRHGCFCAHPYLLHLLQVPEKQAAVVRSRILSGDRREVPGMVRVSFGLYNSKDEIDVLIDAIKSIGAGRYSGIYLQDCATGEWRPRDIPDDFVEPFF